MIPTEANPIPTIAAPPIPEQNAKSRWANRSAEQKAADRADAMKYVRKGRPLPDGKAFFEVVQGTWPGDESDEQINEMLEGLS